VTLFVIATVALAGFVGAVACQHLLNSALTPSRHMISEYANGRAGWLMTAGFASWALSLAAASVMERRCTTRARAVMSMLLAIAAAGMVVTAIFPTQTVAGMLPAGTTRSVAGRLHDLGSDTTQLALFAAVVTHALDRGLPAWSRRLAAMLLCAGVGTIVVLVAAGDPVPGLRQRVLVLIAVMWQLGWMLAVTASSPGPGRGGAW
jgi:hypothetical protein